MNKTTLIISVGGSIEPILYSIKNNNPDTVIFFVSYITRDIVKGKIISNLQKADNTHIPYDFILTPDEQSIGKSTFVLLNEIPKITKKLTGQMKFPEMVDYTGGTKTMSAALVWACSEYSKKFSYIGSLYPSGRDKNRAGIVISGQERSFLSENPWNQIAFFEINKGIDLFNQNLFPQAIKIFEKAEKKITNEKK
ncbi:MAG: hypothetical protein U9O87_06825 [Verrucomicrobiota bacterium]|nr:hypothetical protein [Verrucomicrobiota bacterium]